MNTDFNIDSKTGLKIAGYGLAASAASVLLLSSFTIVPAGVTKVQTIFGSVTDTPFNEGFHFPVNPFSSFDSFDTRNAKYEIQGLNIPTQDRFNSTGNVTVLYRIDSSKAPYIKQNYGTIDEYINKTLRQQLRSIIRDEGRKVKDSRGLADSTTVSTMQENAQTRLVKALDGTGISINEILIQDISFDPRIEKQILATQERIQIEEQKKSQERIAATEAEILKQQAIGEANRKKEAADAEAYRITADADARKEAAIANAEGIAEARRIKADADAYAIREIAKANIELSKSLTPTILKKQELENQRVLFSNSKGNVPQTVIGDTDLTAYGVPFNTQISK